MRPPANRRKNVNIARRGYFHSTCFNEAACEQAEEQARRAASAWDLAGFNEAACEQAEERTIARSVLYRLFSFNEAACEQAEERRS